MKPEHFEVLSALVDGERVDPSLLAEALADHDAAGVLADFAELSMLARADVPEPSDAFYRRMAWLLRRTGLRDRVARVLRPAVAAALLVAAGAAGFMLRPVTGRPPTAATPPRATPLRSATAVATVPPPAAAVGPDTRVRRGTNAPPASALRLRFAHWQETGAGSGHVPE